MHNAPSEASILRSMYEKEVKDHEATKLQLKAMRKRAQDLLDYDGADSGDYIDFVRNVADNIVTHEYE